MWNCFCLEHEMSEEEIRGSDVAEVVGTARGIAGLYGSLSMYKPEILRCKKQQFYSNIRSSGDMASLSLENFSFRGVCLFRGHQHLPSACAS